MKRALIVGGGPVDTGILMSEFAKKPDLLIAVDYGGFYCHKAGITPQVLIGDFDSLSLPVVDKLENAGARVIRFSPQKDQTDMELALDFAMAENAGLVNILGGLGRRIDHTLSNIGLFFKAAAHNIELHLLDKGHDITATSHRKVLEKKLDWAVSLVPLTAKVSGVTTSGLLYPLDKADLFSENSRGIHNEFSEPVAIIELTEGILLVILFKVS